MTNFDWTSFTKSINVKAPKQTVYDFFATRDGMESWFLRLCEYRDAEGNECTPYQLVDEGFSYKWLWHGWADDVEENGKILEANGEDLFEFTFNSNGTTDMIVTVNIEEEEDECIVKLKQFNIPNDEKGKTHFHLGCSEGWTFYLANLKSIMEGGIDLRNKNPQNLKHKVINS